MMPNVASQMRTAFSNMARKHGLKITCRPADDLKHLRGCYLLLQRVAKIAGQPSHLRFPAIRDELELTATFRASRRVGFSALRCCPFIALPPVPDHLFIASPVG